MMPQDVMCGLKNGKPLNFHVFLWQDFLKSVQIHGVSSRNEVVHQRNAY